MTSVLLFAATTGYQIRSFGEAAERLGVRLLFASDRCDRLDDPWWDGAIPIRFTDIDASVAAVVAACQSHRPSGVLAVGDRPAVVAAHAAAALGLDGHPPSAAEASRNKLAARQAFARAGLPVPRFDVMPASSEGRLPALDFPVVVKPLALSGSRGVMRANDAAELTDAVARLRRLLHARDIASERDRLHERILVEQFIPGREYAVEGVVTRGRLQVLAVFDKPDPLDGPFFEETIYVTPSREPERVQEAIADAVSRAAGALGLTHGPVHAECRINAGGVYVLEVAARPIGGLCARALRFGDDVQATVTLEDVLLQHALGRSIEPYRLADGASGVMMIPIPMRGVFKGVRGLREAGAVAGIEDIRVTAKLDSVVVPLPDGRNYLGFIFARGTHPAQVERALRDAHALLEFDIARELTLAD